MSQKAMKTFRFLIWMGIALFWLAVFSSRLPGIGLFASDVFYALLYTVACLTMFQGLTTAFYLMRESDESLENQDKIYKALERLEDIESC